jgi:hypothetical protein
LHIPGFCNHRLLAGLEGMMRFTPKLQQEIPPRRYAKVGDVYPAKGGRGENRFWVVIAVNKNHYAACIGIGEEGQVTSCQTYGAWAFEDRPLVGRCEGIDEMNFEIDWTEQP